MTQLLIVKQYGIFVLRYRSKIYIIQSILVRRTLQKLRFHISYTTLHQHLAINDFHLFLHFGHLFIKILLTS